MFVKFEPKAYGPTYITNPAHDGNENLVQHTRSVSCWQPHCTRMYTLNLFYHVGNEAKDDA